MTYSSAGACSNAGTTFTMTSGTGTCTVKYDQAGNTNYNAATQVTEAVSAQKVNQTITFAQPTTPATYDATFNVNPTSSSGLAVTLATSDGCTAVAAPAPATGYDVTMTSGTTACVLTATQDGDARYDAATQVVRTVAAAKANQTITFGALGNKTYGDADFTVGATASSGLAVSYSVDSTGQCTIAGSTVTITGAGSCTVTAAQAGDSNYNTAQSVPQSFTIAKANQTISVTTAAPSSAAYNSTFTVAATASSGLAVTYSSAGACSNAGATFTMTSSTGTCTVTYDQAGNSNYNAATQMTEAVSAQKANQTITFNALGNKTYGDAAFGVSASASSGLTVSFSASGNCTTSGSTVTITGAGSCMVTALQAGDSNHNAATAVPQSFTIAKATLTVKADDKTMTYGANVPTFTYTMSGFVNSETESGLRNATPAGLSGSVTFSTSPTASSSSPAGVSTIVPNVSGLSATNYNFTAQDGSLTVAKRQATVVYTGDNYVVTAAAGSATVNVSAKVARSGSLGDLTLARVQFTVTKFGGAVQTTVYTMVDANGNATTTVSVPTSDDPYTVEVQIDPTNVFWTSGVDVSSLQAIVGSGTGRTAGGGWIPDAANAINGKSNFGFTVANSKNGIRGNSLFIYRVLEGSDQVQYVVKSNSWQGGGLAFTVNGDPTRATFTGRATLRRYVNGVLDTTFNSGGYTFTVDNVDGDLKSPRVADGYTISLRNGSNVIVKQLGSRSAPVTLGGGNVLIQK